jgi:hypothetical protein
MSTTSDNTPTVNLVHGGFADASFWTPVIQRLQANGIPVLAPLGQRSGTGAVGGRRGGSRGTRWLDGRRLTGQGSPGPRGLD